MKVIALRGPVNCGKSHTINIAYSFALRDGYTQIPGHFRTLGNPAFEDVIDILSMDNITLGFIGMGDYQRGSNSLATLLNELLIKGCTVVICACQNIPNIEKAVTHYTPHHFVNKSPSGTVDNYRIANTADAQALIMLI